MSALLATALAALSGCAGPAGGPRVTPAPPAAPVAFTYAPGTYRYVVTSEATIELTAGGPPRRETVATTAHVTYSLDGEAGERRVTGAVDSFVVGSGGAAGAEPRQPLRGPARFRATLDQGRTHVAFRAGAEPDCDAPTGSLLLTARELLVPIPPAPTRGTVWHDTVSASLCRGDVPLAVRVLHTYEVLGRGTFDGVSALRVRRSTTTELAGDAVRRGVRVSIEGRGRGRGELFFDPARGRLLGGTGQSDTELTIGDGATVHRFRQRVTQRAALAPAVAPPTPSRRPPSRTPR